MKNSGRICHNLYVHKISQDECHSQISSFPIQHLMFHCESDRKLDIGALCYKDKNYQSRLSPKPVDVSSLRQERIEPLRAWCTYSSAYFYEEGSGYSLYQAGSELARLCVWCDENGHEDFLVDPAAYKSALDEYTVYLLNNIQSGAHGSFVANRLQSQAIVCGNVFFPGSPLNFRANLPIIACPGLRERKSTHTPSKEEMAGYLTPCQYIFDGLTDFLVGSKSFPHRIPYMETYALLSPMEFPIVTPTIALQKGKIKASIIWNYKTGQVNSLSECISNSLSSTVGVRSRHDKALKSLEEANLNMRHSKRMFLAKVCQDAFFALFVANTGMNTSPIRNLLYSDSFEYSRSKNQGFRIVKCRAGGMLQVFEIHNTFIKQFKKFIKLRAYINEGINSPYLFIGFKHYIPSKDRIAGELIQGHNDRVVYFLDTQFKGLTARELRKYKPVYLLSRGYSIPVVAAAMQHSGKTTISYYSDAEEKVAIEEISAVLTLASEIFDSHHAQNSPAGGCNTGNPSMPVLTPEAYRPDCKSFLGCIFCSEFRVHADEDGIRKLLSMRYIISEYLAACKDIDHFQKIHGEALSRIDKILSRLIEIRPELQDTINNIRKEIQAEFKLHPYWERLSERLIKIKVLK